MTSSTEPELPRVAVSCVAENSPEWFTKAYNLALSVREFGGTLAGSPIVVNFVGEVEKEFHDRLTRDLGVTVRIIEPFEASVAPTNKIRMLDLFDEMNCDVLVALDCDILVTGDVGAWLPSSGIALRPEARNPLTRHQWLTIFHDLGIVVPDANCRMISTGQSTYPYYNSGVVFIHRDSVVELRETWSRYVRMFDDLCDRWTDNPPRRWWADQIALACSAASASFLVQTFPVGLNFPTIFRVHSHYDDQIHPPFLVHYHNQINGLGFVLASRNRVVNPYIDSFNSARARALNLPYDRLPRPPLLHSIRSAMAEHRWYESKAARRIRHSAPLKVIRRIVR